ncbi:MAG: strawberry notch C-terminal domain-containing protein, partial [Leptolyngbyaceae cyanobacterium bins.59]|nr:strawberry notch C-terminal domain-containing protein [Leptolyngbyaceae cyanobacterium bins.59]
MNFTSLMGNVIDQGLLCQKAEATVQEAIAAINRSQKPVIAVANTMEAFIKQFAEDQGLAPGDAINISFGDVLSRYLERSRDVTIKDHEGKAIRRRMGDDELGPEALAAYDHARDRIEAIDLSTIPLSSIDYIKWRLSQEGYRIREITGRQHIIDYDSTGEQGYGRRSAKETTPQAKVEVVDQFNRGDLDILVLNRSGATGINLHASEKFADQQQRHLIVAQAERDINQVMQMLGRVNRFGQVVEPEITLLMSDLPAEKRLGAILSKKMATLNANTTADRDSALSIANVVDFLNLYGEEVVNEILEDRLELEAQLAYPSKGLQGDSETELISRVTGRIPLLSVREQEDLYHLIETETLDLIAQKQAMGESVLEAQQLDLGARTIARMEVIPDDSTVCNEFTGPVYLDVVDAKIPVKPFSQLEVINIVREHLNLEPVQDLTQHEFDRIEKVAREHSQTAIHELRQAVNQHRTEVLKSKDFGYDQNKLTDRLKEQFAHVSGILRTYPPGGTVRVVSPEGNITYGVVARVWQKGHNGSPAAPTNWRAEILTDNQARTLTIPLTRFNRGKEDQITTISREVTNWEGQDIYAAFDLRQQTDRMERQIFQGNLLKAYEKYPNGKFVNFTDDRGQVCQGLIMPASFDIQESLRSQPVAFHEPHQVKAFLTEITQFQGAVKTLDEVLTLKTQVAARFGSSGDGFLLQTPKTAEGDRFSLNQAIIAAAGSDFYSVSDRMELLVPAERMDAVLHILMKDQQQTLAAFDFKEKAREFLGIHLPEMKAVPQVQAVHCKAEEPAAIESLPRSEIAPVYQQSGGAEKNVAKFLHQSRLTEAVLEGEDFHLRIEHEPYIPLVVERHNNALFLTHYLEQNGDLFIDAELVLRVDSNGQLHLQETATQDPIRGGECRGCDRGFAQLFSRNLLQQGFAEAAQAQRQPIKDFLDGSPSPNDTPHSSTPTMQDPNTTPPEAVEPGCEVIEQSTLFSMTQYESNIPVSSTTGLDQAWVAWEHQAHEPEHPEPQRSPEVEPVSTQTLPHYSSDWKQLADRVRDLPLIDLAQQFGLEQDRSDKAKWRMNGFCLSINGSKFFDHYADKGGVG